MHVNTHKKTEPSWELNVRETFLCQQGGERVWGKDEKDSVCSFPVRTHKVILTQTQTCTHMHTHTHTGRT